MSEDEKDNDSGEIGQDIFDNTCDSFNEFLMGLLDKTSKKYKDKIPEDERFDRLTDPVMAAVMAVYTEYAYNMGYSKGDLLERMWEFYDNVEENDDDEEHVCEECAAEAAAKQELEKKTNLN